MASLDEKRTLERQRFFDGQRLLASDLDGIVAEHRWRRELHNRSLHQPGIGNGFAVTGEPEDREVAIGAGYALDAEGREIISTRGRTEPVPPVAGDPDGGPANYDLTVSYPSAADLEEAETRAGLCTERGVIRLREEPVFCWVRLERDAAGNLHPADAGLAAEIESALRIRLARIEVEHCRLKSLTIAERRNARPAVQPYLSCGQVTPVWTVEALGAEGVFLSSGAEAPLPVAGLGVEALAVARPFPPFFFTATIDTSAAGFRGTPSYTADLRGPRFINVELDFDSVSQQAAIFADGIVSVEDAAADHFRVRVVPILLIDPAFDLQPEQITVSWSVEWMGIEP